MNAIAFYLIRVNRITIHAGDTNTIFIVHWLPTRGKA